MLYALRTLHGQDTEMVATDSIEHDHVKGGGCCSLLIKPSHMETIRVGASVDELVDGSLVAVKGKHDRPVCCEVLYEGSIVQAVGVDVWCVKLHQVDNIHNAYLQFGNMVT